MDIRPPATITLLEGQKALAAIVATWTDLYRRDHHATPYQSPGWINAWAAQLAPQVTPLLLLAHRGRTALSALALAKTAVYGTPTITALSSPHAEYIRLVGPESEDPATVELLVDALNAAKADTVLPDLPAESELARQLAQQPGWRLTATSRCAQVPTPVNYSALSRTNRRVHVRRQRRWGEMTGDGRVEYRRSRTANELLDALDVLSELARRQGRPLEQDGPDTADFQYRRAVELCGPDSASVATLTLDGSPAAAQLCLHRGSRWYSLIPAMDPGLRAMAPGHALLRALTRDLGTHRGTFLDLGRTLDDEGQIAYKDQYGPRWTTTVTYSTVTTTTTSGSAGPARLATALNAATPWGSPAISEHES